MESKLEFDLFEEVDYFQFQIKAQKHLNANTKDKWELFCQHLNAFNEEMSLKFMLMRLVFRCLDQPVSHLELAQCLSLTKQVKAGFGVGLLRQLFEANLSVPLLGDYLKVLQLLHDLVGTKSVTPLVQSTLPDLPKLINELMSLQSLRFDSLYPKRKIEDLLENFATVDELSPFPLKKAELEQFKDPYLNIMSLQNDYKTLTQTTLKELFLEQGKLFRSENNQEAKIKLICLIIETLRRTYKIVPYDTQIIAFLALINTPKELKGRIGQVKTGEGKSTLLCMLVAFMAAQGFFVDLVTSSSYLAIRDYEKYAPFLKALGLSSSHISTPEPKAEQFYAQILYGTNTDFEFAVLRDGLNHRKLRYSYTLHDHRLVPRSQDIVFIDEVDNMLLDNQGAARIAIGGGQSSPWIYKPILNFIKHSLGKTVDELRQYLRIQLTAAQSQELAAIPDGKLSRWLSSAKIALYEKVEEKHYIVRDNKIVIVDYDNTGQTHEGSQWQHGIHQFIQAKHDLKIKAESLTAASISHPSYFGAYQEIYGLTGTLGDQCEREEIQDIYQVASFDVPPHRPSQCQYLPPQIVANGEEQQRALLQLLQTTIKTNQPVLVIFKSIVESKDFSAFLTYSGLSHQVLNGTQRESDAYIVARAGEPRTITIATNKACRGTDIILSPLSQSAGGLLQIFTYYPKNLRVEGQGKGRAARQGQKGSCIMMLRADDSYILSLLQENSGWPFANTLEKVAILTKLRSIQVQEESLRRRYHSQLEKLLFSYLTQFFDQLQKVQDLLQDPQMNTQLLSICQTSVPPSECELLSKKSMSWIGLMQNAAVLMFNQEQNKSIDWQPFVSQFKTVMVALLQNHWANFYSTVSDEVYGMTIEKAQSHLKNQVEDLKLSMVFSQEVVINCLQSILYKASRQKPSQISFFNASGLHLVVTDSEQLQNNFVASTPHPP